MKARAHDPRNAPPIAPIAPLAPLAKGAAPMTSTKRLSEIGLAVLEAREAARRVRDIVGRLAEPSSSTRIRTHPSPSHYPPATFAGGARLIVTDDAATLHDTPWDALSREGGFEVASVEDAARRLASSERFDAIMCFARRKGDRSSAYETVVQLGPSHARWFVLVAVDAA